MDDFGTVTEPTEEERHVSRRQLAQQAIALAVQSRWQEAAGFNEQIVAMAPDDAEAYNRLGKAYTELGRIAEAREAYQRALAADAANLIAQRNLERLSRINESEASEIARKAGQKLDPQFFIEETGKTGVTALRDLGEPAVLATLTAGDQVQLEQKDNNLTITTMDGTYVGKVEDQLALRLTRLMKSGNRYQAGIVGVEDSIVRIIMRETYQAPENVGRISFPSRGRQETLPRPYLREGLMRRSASDEEDEDEVEIDTDLDSDDEEDDDSSDFGFHESALDEA